MSNVTLLLDENTNGALTAALESLGYDVIPAANIVSRIYLLTWTTTN